MDRIIFWHDTIYDVPDTHSVYCTDVFMMNYVLIQVLL